MLMIKNIDDWENPHAYGSGICIQSQRGKMSEQVIFLALLGFEQVNVLFFVSFTILLLLWIIRCHIFVYVYNVHEVILVE